MKILTKHGAKYLVEITEEDLKIYNFGKAYLSAMFLVFITCLIKKMYDSVKLHFFIT